MSRKRAREIKCHFDVELPADLYHELMQEFIKYECTKYRYISFPQFAGQIIASYLSCDLVESK